MLVTAQINNAVSEGVTHANQEANRKSVISLVAAKLRANRLDARQRPDLLGGRGAVLSPHDTPGISFDDSIVYRLVSNYDM